MAVPLVGLLAIGFVVVSQSAWLHRRAQEAVARQLADLSGRQVQVGVVTGNLITGAEVAGIAVARGDAVSDGAVLSARRVRLSYDLPAILLRTKTPAAAVREVHVEALEAEVTRYADGRLNLQDLLPPPEKPVPPEDQFHGQVHFQDTRLHYTDHGDTFAAAALHLELTDVSGTVDLTQPGLIRADLAGRAAGGQFAAIAADAAWDSATGEFSLDAEVGDLDLAWLQRRFWPARDLAVTGGRAQLQASVYRVRASAAQELGYCVHADLGSTAVALPALAGGPVRVAGPLTVTPQGVTTDGLQLKWQGSDVWLAGGLMDLQEPTLDLQVRATGLDAARLVRLLPARTAASLPDFSVTGPLDVDMNVTGPLTHACVDAVVQAAGETRLSPADGINLTGRQVTVGLSLLDSAEPALVGKVDVASLDPGTIRLDYNQAPHLPEAITVSPLSDVSAEVQWAAGRPLAHTQLALDTVSVGGIELSDVAAEVALTGRTLQLHDLQAQLMQGSLTGEAVLDFSQASPAVYANGTLSQIDLAELDKLPAELTGLESVPQGRVTAAFGLKYRDRQLTSAASITGTGLAYQQYGAARAAALARQEGQDIHIMSAFAADPLATLWTKGRLKNYHRGADTELDLDFQVAEMQLGEIMGRLEVDGVDGVLYAQGQVDGTFAEPAVRASAAVFEPRYQDYDADALTAELVADRSHLDVTQLLATRGSAALSASGSLANLSGVMAAGPGDDAAGRAQIAGRFELAGVQLAEVVELLGRDWEDIDGLAEADGVFSGTVTSPIVAGTVQVAHALTSTLDITEGRIPYEFSDDVLTVEDAVFEAQGSELRARGSLDFRDEPVLSASLAAADIYLEGIHQLQDLNLEVAGLLQIPVAHIEGPLDDLTGEGLVVSEQVHLGDEVLDDLLGEATLKKGVVNLEHLRCRVAGGQFSVTGHYYQDSKSIDGYLTLSDTSASELLAIVRPVAEAATAENTSPADRQSLLRGLDSMSLRLDGQVYADVDILGTWDAPWAEGAVRLQEATFDEVGIPQVQVQAKANREALYDITAEAREADALITAEGDLEFGGEVNLLIIGSGVELAAYEPWMPLATDIAGELGFTIAASGKTRQPQIRASIDIIEPGIAGIRFDMLQAPIITLTEGELDIDTLIVKRGEQEVAVDGTLPFSWKPLGIVADREMAAKATVEETQLALVPVLINEAVQHKARRDGTEAPATWERMVVSGSINSAVELTGTPQAPSLFGLLRIHDGSIALDETKTPLKDIAIALEFGGRGPVNTLVVKQAEAVWDNTRLSLDGKAEFRDLAVASLPKNTYDLTLTVAGDQQQLVKGLVARGLGGKLTLKGGGERPPELTVDQLAGSFGKGRIALNGNAQMADFHLAGLAGNQIDMALVAQDSEVAVTGLLKGIFDGKVGIVGPGGGRPALVSGNYTISHGQVGFAGGGGGGKQEFYALSSKYPQPRLDVKVGLGLDMKVRGTGIVAPLRPTPDALHLHGTPQTPTVEGWVQAQEGRTQIPGGVATIQELWVDYRLSPKPPLRRDPVALELTGNVRGSAQTVLRSASLYGQDIGAVTINIYLSGMLPDRWDLQVSSTPPLEESQIYALLGTTPLGGLLAEGGPTDIEQMVSEQFLAALAAGFKMAVFEPIEQQLRRALGLSELSVNFTFNQPVEIRVGKYVMDNLLVSYRTAFGGDEAEYDMTVAYEVGHDLRVSYTTDERSRNRVQLEKLWQF